MRSAAADLGRCGQAARCWLRRNAQAGHAGRIEATTDQRQADQRRRGLRTGRPASSSWRAREEIQNVAERGVPEATELAEAYREALRRRRAPDAAPTPREPARCASVRR